MKKTKQYIKIVSLAAVCIFGTTAYAQKKQGKNKGPVVDVKSVVVDNNDNPIADATILAGENAAPIQTGETGEFSLKVRNNATLIIEAKGYKDTLIQLSQYPLGAKVVLTKEPFFAGKEDVLERANETKVYQRDLVGAISVINGRDLEKYPDLVLTNALQGKAAGLIVRNNVSGLGNNTPGIFVRGQHTKGGDGALVVIDGVTRPLADLIPEEIERIEVLKDATAKVLYGSRATNGVLLVTTRRGEQNRNRLKVTTEYGSSFTSRMPEFLNSAQYAGLYNEARANDGLLPFYSSEQIEGYKNSTGVDDLLYPNVDYSKEFLKSSTPYKKAVLDMNGGNNKVRYSVVTGYTGAEGIENVKESTTLHRLNFRGNLDVEVNDVVSFFAGVSARMEMRSWGDKDGGQIFSAITSHRPNEYPFTISPEDIGMDPDTLTGIPYFGASRAKVDNLYADVMYGGKTSERYTNNQTNLGLNFDLGKYVKGLKANGVITFDNYDFYKENQLPSYATYAVDTYYNEAGELDTLFTKMRNNVLVTEKNRANASTLRSLNWRGSLSYERDLGDHDINAAVAHSYSKFETKGVSQDPINSNTSLMLNYSFKNKYVLEFNSALMGSNRYAEGNRFFFAPTGGAAWIISNEDFFNKDGVIDFLKLKASYGILGYDSNTDFLLYQKAWTYNGKVQFGENNSGASSFITRFIRNGNPDLKWEQSAELNVGMEGLFLAGRLSSEVNYFNEKRTNIVAFDGDMYADFLGDYTYPTNMGRVDNQGVDLAINWTDRIGDLVYSVGGNMVWSKTNLKEWNNTVPAEESYRSAINKPLDTMNGYVAQGLFGKDVPLAGHDFQTLGPYQEGDIAYTDQNNDGIIDSRDVTKIGNSFPRTSFGINVDLKYKGWALYLQGAGELGVNAWASNSYFWNRGEDKYSTKTLDRYHPVNNPNGTYPRLTTTNGDNNFKNSTFWLLDTDFFRLRNAELSYTFVNKNTNAVAKQIKCFTRGTNLFVLSSVKDVDPELVNGGLANYPLLKTVTAGISLTF